MVGATERLEHVAKLLPEICTLDCGTMNFGEGDYIMVNSPAMLKAMAGQIRDLGVRPEIEIFDGGHLVLAKWLKDQGLIDDPVMLQLVHGRALGVARRHRHLHRRWINNLPQGWTFSALIHRPQPAALCGARRAGQRQHPRGARGQICGSATAQLATNAQLSSALCRPPRPWAAGSSARMRFAKDSS